jgi:predicted 2-oxoglutarate/Fe(II)-dependent dioxygenase YbiX
LNRAQPKTLGRERRPDIRSLTVATSPMIALDAVNARERPCAELLAEIGAMAIPGAIDMRICDGLIREMLSCPASATRPISGETMQREYHPDFALSETLEASPFAQSLVELILTHHLARLEEFFGQPLELNTELHFLTYQQGGFIRPHRDVMHADGVLETISERVVLFTLFLNGPDGPSGHSFEGGEFVFYPTSIQRLTLTCAPGVLLAFRADLVHSVHVVTAGTRHSVAGWLRSPRTGH